jgi:hypothetical protein
MLRGEVKTMSRLIRFNELKSENPLVSAPVDRSEDATTPTLIDRLRHRLVSRDYCDSIDVKTAIVGELVYHCYKELMKKSYL